MQVNLYNRAYLIHNTSILINNHTTSYDSKLIHWITQHNLVSGRNHLTCAFLTSGHMLRLSFRLSPSLTTLHPHIKFRAAILQAQLFHLTFSFFFMWPLLELSSRLSSRFHISEGYLMSTNLQAYRIVTSSNKISFHRDWRIDYWNNHYVYLFRQRNRVWILKTNTKSK